MLSQPIAYFFLYL
jgi:hypothetical protein